MNSIRASSLFRVMLMQVAPYAIVSAALIYIGLEMAKMNAGPGAGLQRTEACLILRGTQVMDISWRQSWVWDGYWFKMKNFVDLVAYGADGRPCLASVPAADVEAVDKVKADLIGKTL